MLKYFISIITFLFVNITIGNVKIANDTLEKFGVRAGLDLNKIIRSATDEDYSGFSLSGDIRLKESYHHTVTPSVPWEEKYIILYFPTNSLLDFCDPSADKYHLLLGKQPPCES